ncbi:hypothetical protein F1542_02385 [Komagataeibacter sp. FXV3]|nr:hypothetical protein [Komagataeibacter sp. FXV3]
MLRGCLKSPSGKHPAIIKLFSGGSGKRYLFEKRQHPKTFIVFYQCAVFKQSLRPEPGASAGLYAQFVGFPGLSGIGGASPGFGLGAGFSGGYWSGVLLI